MIFLAFSSAIKWAWIRSRNVGSRRASLAHFSGALKMRNRVRGMSYYLKSKILGMIASRKIILEGSFSSVSKSIKKFIEISSSYCRRIFLQFLGKNSRNLRIFCHIHNKFQCQNLDTEFCRRQVLFSKF